MNGWRARSTRRRDPAWTADGFVSDRWLPVSPVTGKLDAFEWKDPLAGRDHAGAMIDAEQRAMLDAPAGRAAVATAALAGGSLASVVTPGMDMRNAAAEGHFANSASPERHSPPPLVVPVGTEKDDTNATADLSPEQPSLAEPDAYGSAGVTPAAPAVIPLVHAPDDPGADPEAPPEPAQEPPPEPPPDGWSRFRSLFK